MPKKTKIEQWQRQLGQQQEILDKMKAKLAFLIHHLTPDNASEIAAVEKAIADHEASAARLLEKIEAVNA